MRRAILEILLLSLMAMTLSAQTADEIIAKYIKTIGGMKKIQSAKTIIRSGKFTGGGGFEAEVRQENKRPNMVREEFSIQGMVGINAYDGKTGWKTEPWNGKKDVETLGEEEMRQILEDSDFDGPLVNYQQKGNKVKFLGTEPVEGTDALKLEVTFPNGDSYTYYMDTDYYVPIKIDIKRIIRGEEQNYEATLGDYKEVDGWYFPFSLEYNAKGSTNRSKISYEKIETNVSLANDRFTKPEMPVQPGK